MVKSETKELKPPKIISRNGRVIIEHVRPEIDGGLYPIKRTVGEDVVVHADIFTDGHDNVAGEVLYRKASEKTWHKQPMTFMGNDIWRASFPIEVQEQYVYTVQAWMDYFTTWRKDILKKWAAAQEIRVDLRIGAEMIKKTAAKADKKDARTLNEWARLIEEGKNVHHAMIVIQQDDLPALMARYCDQEHLVRYSKELMVRVDRPKAVCSAWYEFFPRSWSSEAGRHGTFRDCERILPEIARMGFDVVYLPPIHPIGTTNRKGKNNSTVCQAGDPGSPWAIGNREGGHKAIHPELGTMEDFQRFTTKAADLGLEVALDIAFQCSPDHPYVREHPQWFKWRPDGTIQFAENPPKKYEDVLPLNFDTDDWENLWEELKSVFLFWIQHGIKIFRVDNPHTKPFAFWDWVIGEIRKDYPDVIFLSEAFTRPRVMYRLAKGGFDQSYTYFTWRNTKQEFIDYMIELTQTEVADYFRPNFWPNTPDILPEHLQHGGRPAFMMRLALAALLSSNYGVYGPAFELCVHEAVPGKEEYLNSEKYELKFWTWDQEGNLKDFIASINAIRRQNPALQATRNIRFVRLDNPALLAFIKTNRDKSNIVLVVINLDPYHTQSGWVHIPTQELGIDPSSYLAHDMLSRDDYIWQGDCNFVELNPHNTPVHVIHLRQREHRE